MKFSWSAVKADFDLNGITEVYFYKSEWETFDPHDHHVGVSPFYFCYRFLYMAIFIGASVENFICGDDINNGHYFIFLTNQTFTVQLVYSMVYFVYILWIFCAKLKEKHQGLKKDQSPAFHDQQYRLPVVCKILWITINILNVVPYVVTLIYWAILFREQTYDSTCQMVDDILVHGMNSPLVLLDAFVMSIPIRRTHAIFPVLFSVYYTVFSGLYEVFGGTYSNGGDYIYPILNWKRKPGLAAVTCIVCTIGAVFVHFALSWGIYRLRIFMKSKYMDKSSDHYDNYGREKTSNSLK